MGYAVGTPIVGAGVARLRLVCDVVDRPNAQRAMESRMVRPRRPQSQIRLAPDKTLLIDVFPCAASLTPRHVLDVVAHGGV